MYFQNAISCQTYDEFAPTKQNLLCQRRPRLDVVLSHADYNKSPNRAELSAFAGKIVNPESFEVKGDNFIEPEFNFAFPGIKRFVLVIDVAEASVKADQWQRLREAIFRFFVHVPSGSEVAIVTFAGANARVNVEPTIVEDSNREGLFGKVPIRLVTDEKDSCVECGLEMASKVLRLKTKEGFHFSSGSVLLFAGKSDLNQEYEFDRVPLYNIAFDSKVTRISDLARFNGDNFLLNLNSASLSSQAADVFIDIFNRDNNRKLAKTFEKTHKWSRETVGKFAVEENLNNDLYIVLKAGHVADLDVFEVTSPSGMKLTLYKIDNGLAYYHLSGMNDVGIWSYRVRMLEGAFSEADLVIEVVAKAGRDNNDHVRLEAWTNVDSARGVDVKNEAVILYAKVSQDELPVREAEVEAFVTRPGSSKAFKVLLRDDGTGYPDITAGDGIYSAYFLDFTTKAGLYSVKVIAKDVPGYTTIPKSRQMINDDSSCCGSSIGDDLEVMPTRSFEQHVAAGAFKAKNGLEFRLGSEGPQRVDIFPPSRVTDFRVGAYVNMTLYATLTWSAPGNDLDSGKAAKYEIRCYTNQKALSDETFFEQGIPVHESLLPSPGNFGEEQTATVALPWANEVFYYGLVAVDEAGNRSPVSNLVPVYAAEVPSTTESLWDNDVDSNSAELLDRLTEEMGFTYLIAGCVSAIIFILVLIVGIAVCRNRKRSDEKKAKRQRTQIFVNDIETPSNSSSQEKVDGLDYGVWTTTTATNSNPSPSNSDDYFKHPTTTSLSDQASWAYVHPHNPQLQQHLSVKQQHQQQQTHYQQQEAATYQNWTKPPSDNGTATTSTASTEGCDEQQQHQQQPRRYSTEDELQAYHENVHSASYTSERRRRQESLV